MTVGDQIRQTLNRFRNIDEYEAYINAIDEGYDAEDAIYQLKDIVSLNVIILYQVKIITNIIWTFLEMKNDDQIL